MRRTVFLFMVLALIAAARTAPAAQWANPDLLLSAEQVAQKSPDPKWVIVDCRDLEDYLKGHIPGAISFGAECKKALRDGTARAFRDPAKYNKIFGKVGIGNDTNVVFYADMKTESMDSAAVGFWLMEYAGHEKAHFMNGGLEAWIKDGRKLETKPSIRQEATFTAKFAKSRIAPTEEILKIAKGQETGVQLIDARTKEEHEGRDIRALRGGHVPHTTANIDYLKTFDTVKDQATGKEKPTGFLSPDKVAQAFGALDRNKRTIAHCQTGTRSTVEYLEMRLLGFKQPANWDDSWIVWGNGVAKGYPVEDEQWIDFARIKQLEKKVKKLQAQLKAQEH